MTTLGPEQIAKGLIEEAGGQWEFDPDDEAQVRAMTNS
jgi:hypothetical protein